MNSMTGFGRAERRTPFGDIEVELRSVNHRFFFLKQSLPEGFSRYEPELDRRIRAQIGRGSLTLTVSIKVDQASRPRLPDLRVFRGYHRRLVEIRKALGISGDVELEDLLAIPTLWSDDTLEAPPADRWPAIRALVDQALGHLVATRVREGTAIVRSFRTHLGAIERAVRGVEGRAPASVAAFQKRLDERIRVLLSEKGVQAAPPDIVKEVAVFATRCDVSEELQRLRAHTVEFRALLAASGQIGRRLDFLTQEMMREANTTASKGLDSKISSHAVIIKAELEKIKEQVENVE